MDQLPKLKPTVGGGLPGLPRRTQSTTEPLSQAFNWIGSANYSGNTVDTTVNGGNVSELSMSSNQAVFFKLGASDDIVYQYDMSSDLALDTASYSGNSLSGATESTSMAGMAISADGTKVYMSDTGASASIYQYTLTAANSLIGASYASKSKNISAQTTVPLSLSVSPSGEFIFVLNTSADAIYRYEMSTAGDISTASYSGVFIDVSGDIPNTLSISVSSDGVMLYVGDNLFGAVWQFKMTKPFDLLTASYTGIKINFTNETDGSVIDIEGIAFDHSGKFMLIGDDGADVWQYDIT